MSNDPTDKGFLGNLMDKAGEMAENVKQKAGEVGDVLKDKAEDLIGEENVQKVSNVLNTDVGEAAKNTLDKAEDAVEKVTGIDLDGKPGA
jgi:ElaB/YqjD/DUF883 family membrane-anchored ribosome-binding protein